MAFRLVASKNVAKIPATIAVRALGMGDGAGRGGGGGGSIRDAGGIWGKMEAAREGQYFLKKEQEVLAMLKEHIEEEIAHHKELMQKHKESVARHQKSIREIRRQQGETVEEEEEEKLKVGGL